MSYKGSIDPNSTILVRLSNAAANGKPAILLAGIGVAGGSPTSSSVAVAAGGSAALTLKAGASGTLQVTADFSGDADTGQLEVIVNGAPRTSAAVTGDTWWTYSIEAAPK